MSVKNTSKTDLGLKLMAGMPLQVNNFNINPLKLSKIVELGYSNYNEYLSLITADIEDLIKDIKDIPKGFTTMDLILSSRDEELIGRFIEGLCFFLEEDDYSFHPELGFIFGNADNNIDKLKIVNSENFNEISDILKYQNCIKMPDKDESENPKDERARKIMEKLKEARKKVSKAKKSENGDSNIDFLSIVSAVSTKSNSVSKLTIWDWTIYQLYDEYKRLEMIVGYDTSILAMINGANVKDLRHWSEKIEE